MPSSGSTSQTGAVPASHSQPPSGEGYAIMAVRAWRWFDRAAGVPAVIARWRTAPSAAFMPA